MAQCFRVWAYQEGLEAIDTLNSASKYLASQFSIHLRPEEAQAHFDARALLLRRRNALIDEMELEYVYGEEADGRALHP